MSKDTKAAVEELICSLFVEVLELAKIHGITIKRMRELLPVTQLQALEQAGYSQTEMVAESGYTRKSIRKILSKPVQTDCIHPLDQFIANWDADPQFPDCMAMEGQFPSFEHLHDVYGGEFTAPGLLKLLKERSLVAIEDGQVTLLPDRSVTAHTEVERVKAAQFSIRALFKTLRHNIEYPDQPLTERRIWSSTIPASQLSEYRATVLQVNQVHRKKLMQIMEQFQVSPENAAEAQCMKAVGLGMYWFELNEI